MFISLNHTHICFHIWHPCKRVLTIQYCAHAQYHGTWAKSTQQSRAQNHACASHAHHAEYATTRSAFVRRLEDTKRFVKGHHCIFSSSLLSFLWSSTPFFPRYSISFNFILLFRSCLFYFYFELMMIVGIFIYCNKISTVCTRFTLYLNI